MPMNRSLYPPDWEITALRIKTEADWTCQACQRPCRRPGESVQELIDRIKTEHPAWVKDLYAQVKDREFGDRQAPAKLGRFTLTTAHVHHDPWNPDAKLKAWCSVCHCRYDLKAMPLKKRLKRETNGQLNWLVEAGEWTQVKGGDCP